MERSMPMEAQAYERLWTRYLDRLVFYGTALLRGDRAGAEDLVQGVFTRLLALGRLPAEETEASYLFQAVRNAAQNEARSRGRSERSRGSLFRQSVRDPQSDAELAEFGRAVETELQELSSEEREAVLLRVWGELSIRDGAHTLGITEKAFEHRYTRGLDILKERLGVHDEHA
jgi:RNA polymerase sigma factor (sigma-70 family)